MSRSRTKYDHKVTLILIGDCGVGKTSAMRRFADDEFSPTYIATIGIDFKVRVLTVEGVTFLLEIWDTAGQERYRTITASYYRRADGILIMYDTTNRRTLDSVGMWIKEIERNASRRVDRLLVGSKKDLVKLREVDEGAIEAVVQHTGIPHMEMSSKSGEGVEEAFAALARMVKQRVCLEAKGATTRVEEAANPERTVQLHLDGAPSSSVDLTRPGNKEKEELDAEEKRKKCKC